MARILTGKEVAEAIVLDSKKEVAQLEGNGVTPTLGILRVGEDGDAVAYERSAMKRAASVGIDTRQYLLPEDAEDKELIRVIESVNGDPSIHGLLVFRPLPEHIDEDNVRNVLSPQKDIDGITDLSMAGVFTGSDTGFPPCTVAACMAVLDYYDVEVKGAKITVIGRSHVIGRPVAMMAMRAHATVTICHTWTKDLNKIAAEADILIVAAGKAKMVDVSFTNERQVILDVGIHVDDEGKLCGDVDFESVEPAVKAITPVPGGIGGVTTSVLMSHVLKSAKNCTPLNGRYI